MKGIIQILLEMLNTYRRYMFSDTQFNSSNIAQSDKIAYDCLKVMTDTRRTTDLAMFGL